MKNNFLKTYIFIFSIFFNLNVYAVEQFNFNITEIQILENGNKFKGFKRGEIQADNDIIIIADEFGMFGLILESFWDDSGSSCLAQRRTEGERH